MGVLDKGYPEPPATTVQHVYSKNKKISFRTAERATPQHRSHNSCLLLQQRSVLAVVACTNTLGTITSRLSTHSPDESGGASASLTEEAGATGFSSGCSARLVSWALRPLLSSSWKTGRAAPPRPPNRLLPSSSSPLLRTQRMKLGRWGVDPGRRIPCLTTNEGGTAFLHRNFARLKRHSLQATRSHPIIRPRQQHAACGTKSCSVARLV